MPKRSPMARRSIAARPATTGSSQSLHRSPAVRAIALDRACGEPGPLKFARIDEASCIGCTLCIDACPVDAIVGAAKRMHTVLAAVCTGCELCVAPCPVDCIDDGRAGRAWSSEDARAAGDRYRARIRRLAARASIRLVPSATPADTGRAKRQAAVAAALARARARRAASGGVRAK